MTLTGHRSGISSLCFTQSDSNSVSKGQLLCSGSRDGKLVVWDTIEQRGLFRLQGHKGEITHCQFLTRSYCLLSSSKDTLVKLWDLETQHCTQTLVGHRKEVWTFTVDKEEERVYTGTADPFFRVYEIVYPAEDAATRTPELKSLGNIPRQSKERVCFLVLLLSSPRTHENYRWCNCISTLVVVCWSVKRLERHWSCSMCLKVKILLVGVVEDKVVSRRS